MIRVRGLSKSFGEGERRLDVLRDLDLDVEPGELVAVMGRSGSGKSTLLNLLAGLEVPDAGTVVIEGVDLGALDERRRTVFRRDRIGIVFQFFNLLSVLSALDNVMFPALLAGRPRAAAEARARELLARVGLEDRAEAFPDELSGGEQQRVATARALVNRPAVVLADEPTGNLDAWNGERTLDLLADLARGDGQTVLVATHDAAVAARALRTLVFANGRLESPPSAPRGTELEIERGVAGAAGRGPEEVTRRT